MGKRGRVIKKDCQVSGFSGLGYWLGTSPIPQEGRLRRRERILWKFSSVSDMLSMGISMENVQMDLDFMGLDFRRVFQAGEYRFPESGPLNYGW